MESALAVMLKAPQHGLVKTRLVPPLSYEDAAELSRCLILDTIGMASGVEGVDLFLAYAPAGVEKDIRELAEEAGSPKVAGVFPQVGEDLGVRIFGVFKYLFSSGYDKVAVIGSDSPDMPGDLVTEALGSLGGSDLVLVPARDGGYCLVAMKAPSRAPFKGIPWSTGEVLETTVRRAEASGLSVKLLSGWHDIDTASDLLLLEDNPDAPKSSEFIRKIRNSGVKLT